MPTWMMNSAPSTEVQPIACLVSKTMETVQSAGAYTLPSAGSTAKPSPTMPSENTPSPTSRSGMTVPAIGEANATVGAEAAGDFADGAAAAAGCAILLSGEERKVSRLDLMTATRGP